MRYKGIPSPWEMMEKNKFYGPKCLRYSKWLDVHVSENSRTILLEAGKQLIDQAGITTKYYSELSEIWKGIATWARSPDHSDTEPAELDEYAIFRRTLEVATTNPGIVNSMISDIRLDVSGCGAKQKWTLFLAINYFKYLTAKKRFINILPKDPPITSADQFVSNVIAALKLLCSAATDSYYTKADENFLELFTKDFGFEIEVPKINDVDVYDEEAVRVHIEKYTGSEIELVKFSFSYGKVIIKLNMKNKIFSSNDEFLMSFKSDKYWMLVGETIYSQLGKIDDIQNFYDLLSKKIYLA